MKITEVRIFPTESKDGKLKAFATMTFDDWFVVRNVKVIQGNSGLFVAMPSRKAMGPCSKCSFKNAVGSKYCNQCGAQLDQKQMEAAAEGKDDKQGNHMDIAHPITQDCRIYIQEQILGAYNKEVGPNAQEMKVEAPVETAAGEKAETVTAREPELPKEDAANDIEL